MKKENPEIKKPELRGKYNYLAIGNSITKHGLADYWWSEYGMAASEPNKDYFHRVLEHLKKLHGDKDICGLAYNFSVWEMLATDRAETLGLLDCYLSKDLDLISIQLGENVLDLSTFQSDFEYLLDYIKSSFPKAQLIVIGDFWENAERDKIKQKVAEQCEVPYVDLTEIKDREEYMAELGTSVYGDDKVWHKIEHGGVARHPGDNGMDYIARKIIEIIR